ncbi:hypothetical protein ULMA_25130 [Patiriisocius marinus]|uniref:histidine kinase n=1 Tax=Patiriisocius marinus TaxID=1397112 RepID=A0A5J4IR52_9FLAO|nr:PAS domain-containing sensor histidine kinase [Patiriisocius marinus]GER60405.1 hypothetical protein ULMA_25130 [Patiriisocius marinus]
MKKVSSQIIQNNDIVTDSLIQEKLLSLLSIGIWKYNFSTEELIIDESLLQIIGYNSLSMEIKHLDTILDLVHPREKSNFDFLKPPFTSKLPKNKTFEFRILHENKEWVWIENKCEIVSYTSNNKPEWLVGYVQDISEKKNKEFLSIKYEELLNKTNEVALIGTWEVDLIDNTISWSNVTKKIHGLGDDYSPVLETAINFYKEGTHRNKINDLFNKCVTEGEPFDEELMIVTNDNIEKWVRSIGFPVMEKGVCTRVYGVFQDIDEKNKVLKQLSNTEQKFRKTFDFAGLGMALVGMDTKWLRVNKSLCNMLGYTEEEFLKLKYQDFTHPEDLVDDEVLLKEALEGNLDDYKIEKRYIHKNGEIIWTNLTVSVVKDDEGKPIHFVTQINDISTIKKANKKVTNLLEITKDQNNRLLNFAHIVSHNLRSHSGNLQMLLDLMEIDTPELTQLETFPLLKDAVGQLDETVQNLNEVAVLNTKTELNLENLDLSSYVTKAISNINSVILDDSVSIINKVDDSFIVSAIPAYVDSIILNFLTNAIKYQSAHRYPVVTINAKRKDKFIVLSVEDNGMGIDLNTHGEKLFGMYKTFHKHKDARGLGLFITKNQIEAMGGRVEVLSEVEKGTTFNIYLQNEKN